MRGERDDAACAMRGARFGGLQGENRRNRQHDNQVAREPAENFG